MGGERGSLRKRSLENPFVLPCTVWGRQQGRGDPATESPQADVPASFKMPSSAWICLRLSAVARAGVPIHGLNENHPSHLGCSLLLLGQVH